MVLAKQAERDLNSEAAKNEHNLDNRATHSYGASDSSAYQASSNTHCDSV